VAELQLEPGLLSEDEIHRQLGEGLRKDVQPVLGGGRA
jgi:hypothetical protein